MKNENCFFRNDYPTGEKVEVSKVEETTIVPTGEKVEVSKVEETTIVPTSKQLGETNKYSIVGSELYF